MGGEQGGDAGQRPDGHRDRQGALLRTWTATSRPAGGLGKPWSAWATCPPMPTARNAVLLSFRVHGRDLHRHRSHLRRPRTSPRKTMFIDRTAATASTSTRTTARNATGPWARNAPWRTVSTGSSPAATPGYRYPQYYTGICGREDRVPWVSSGEMPPPPPNMRLVPGHHQVEIFWDDFSEYEPDYLRDVIDFESYRIWRVADWTRPAGHRPGRRPPCGPVGHDRGIRPRQLHPRRSRRFSEHPAPGPQHRPGAGRLRSGLPESTPPSRVWPKPCGISSRPTSTGNMFPGRPLRDSQRRGHPRPGSPDPLGSLAHGPGHLLRRDPPEEAPGVVGKRAIRLLPLPRQRSARRVPDLLLGGGLGPRPDLGSRRRVPGFPWATASSPNPATTFR